MEKYQSIFGGELQVMKFGEIHTAEELGSEAALDQVMHAELRLDGRPIIFASDSPDPSELTVGNDTPIGVTGGKENLEEIKGWWEKLSEGSEIELPFDQVPWGATFGMLTDSFGTKWFFNVAG